MIYNSNYYKVNQMEELKKEIAELKKRIEKLEKEKLDMELVSMKW